MADYSTKVGWQGPPHLGRRAGSACAMWPGGPPLPASMHGQSQKKEEDRRGGKRIVLTYLALVKVAGRGCPLHHYWPLNSKLSFHSTVSLQAELKGDVN